MSHADCGKPPEGDLVEWTVTDGPAGEELWSGVEVTYKCKPDHELKWGETAVAVCGSDGSWSQNTEPACAPGTVYKLMSKLVM